MPPLSRLIADLIAYANVERTALIRDKVELRPLVPPHGPQHVPRGGSLGRVWALSESGQGATFFLAFPQ